MPTKRFNSSITIDATTDSTSLATGVLQTAGGASISKNLTLGGSLNISGKTTGLVSLTGPNNVTSYTMTLPAALPTTPGMALVSDTSGNLTFANAGTGSGTTVIFSAANNVTTPTNVPQFIVTDSSFVYYATVSITSSTTANSTTSMYVIMGTLQPNGTYDFAVEEYGPIKQGILFSITNAGQVQYTSPNVTGWVSTNMNIAKSGNTVSTTLAVTNTTNSTSTTTGGLQVVGGMAVGKNLTVGGYFNLPGSTSGTFSLGAPTNLTSYTLTLPTALPTTAGMALVSDTSGNLSFSNYTAGTGLTLTGTAFSVNASQGGITSLGTLTSLTSSGIVSITNTTDSSYIGSGALVVAGGFSVAGTTRINGLSVGGSTWLTGNNVYIWGTTDATSSTSGTLQISGGVGVQKSLYVGSTIDSTTTATGALQVAGGVAVSKSLTVGNNITLTGGGTIVNSVPVNTSVYRLVASASSSVLIAAGATANISTSMVTVAPAPYSVSFTPATNCVFTIPKTGKWVADFCGNFSSGPNFTANYYAVIQLGYTQGGNTFYAVSTLPGPGAFAYGTSVSLRAWFVAGDTITPSAFNYTSGNITFYINTLTFTYDPI